MNNITPPVVRTMKVINVVFIKETIGYNERVLDFLTKTYEFNNDSYIGYTVGERKDEEDYWLDKDESLEYAWKFRELDELLVKNYGLQDGESVLLLIWW